MDIKEFYNSILNINDIDKSQIVKTIVSEEKEKLSLMVDDFSGFCKYITNQIQCRLEEQNINTYLIDLNHIVEVDHVFLIAEYKYNNNLVRWLIDPTYSQFTNDNSKKLVTLDFWPSSKLDNKILEKLLSDGLIKVDEQLFNNYINSFSRQLIKIDFENYLFDLKFQKKKNY